MLKDNTLEALLRHTSEKAAPTINPPKPPDPKSKGFPTWVLPQEIQDIITATGECLNHPTDFAAASILSAVSMAVGGSHRIQVQVEHIESCALYLALVGNPGVNKSHPLSFALRPLQQRDTDNYKQYLHEKSIYDASLDLTNEERSNQGLDDLVEPIFKRYMIGDATSEAVIQVLQENKYGVGLYADELAGWFKNFNRYNSGSDQEAWLSMWSGQRVTVDRKHSAPIILDDPFISICGTIQTGILDELTKGGKAKNGFFDRILFVKPEGLNKKPWSNKELNLSVRHSWFTVLNRVIDLRDGIEDIQVLKFNPKAKEKALQWQALNCDICNEADEDNAKGIHSKLESYCWRIALIMQMLRYGCGKDTSTEISTQSLEAAIQITEFFRENAMRVIENINDPLSLLTDNKKLFYQSLPTVFAKSDAKEIGIEHGITGGTLDRLLRRKELFKTPKRGEYEKCI